MATFKICVRNRRKDGLWPVYVRLTHNREVQYIRTDLLVNDGGLSKNHEIRDVYVLRKCLAMIDDYAGKINRRDVSNWDAMQIKNFLQGQSKESTFSDFADSYISKMEEAGSVNNAKIYRSAMKSLTRYLHSDRIGFGDLTRESITGWIAFLGDKKRAKTLYPVCVRMIFREAMLTSQDPGSTLAPIVYDPWGRVKIPTSEVPCKRAIPAELCRRFFACEIPTTGKGVRKAAELGRDVAMLSFCLAAINTVDLYKLRKSDLKDGILHYNRSKTAARRKDGAYIEMRVPPLAERLIDKYKSSKDDELLLCFGRSYKSAQSFVAYVDSGIKLVSDMIGLRKDEYLTFYTFRHTWATIAKNDCGASLSEIGFAMNHLQSDAVTRGYIKLDFSPAWELNERVYDFIFNSSSRDTPKQPYSTPTDTALAPSNLHRIAVFHGGSCVLNYEDIGLSDVKEVIQELQGRLPDGISLPDVRVKIVNCDNGKVYVYEHQKGKGFA